MTESHSPPVASTKPISPAPARKSPAEATSAEGTDTTSCPPEARSIVLVGLMGAGKTTVGRRLAQKLNMGFADADIEIERAAGETIPEIFERHGEAAFREGEGDPRETMARLIDQRYPIYAQADIRVESIEGPHELVVDDVINHLEQFKQAHGAKA